MSDSSLTISDATALELIVLAQAGVMTVETYTELMALLGNAKIIKPSTYPAGSANSSQNAPMQEPRSERWFIRSAAPQTQESSTPLSHSECWCNSYRKRVTNDYGN